MDGDPLLVGTAAAFPNQNSSMSSTIWEEDTEQAARQGIPCGSGPMLELRKRSTNQQFLPGGAFNPCPETAPVCLLVDNRRVTPGGSQRLSGGLIAAGQVGAQFVGGVPGSTGLGMVGIGAPGDGVRGISVGQGATGHGVSGFTQSTNIGNAGVAGEAVSGAVGVLGRSPGGSGIGVRGQGSSQAVRGDSGTFGVVGTGTSTGIDGTGLGGGSFGVVGRGTLVGTFGGGAGPGTVGVIGVAGGFGVVGDGRGITSGIGVLGVGGPLSGGILPWAGRFVGPAQVTGALFVGGGLFVSGTKSAVVAHPDGSQRAMYAVEAPQSWFEDVGRARLRQGVAAVELEPDFAAVTGVGDDYHVFLTPEGESAGLYVANRTTTGFEVREQGGGTSDISFSYRIMTPRRDVPGGRLEPVHPSTDAGEQDGVPSGEQPPRLAPEPPGDPLEGDGGRATSEPAPAADGGPAPSDWPHEIVAWPPDLLATSSDES